MARNSRGVEKSIAEFGTTWRIATFAAFERVAQSFDQDGEKIRLTIRIDSGSSPMDRRKELYNYTHIYIYAILYNEYFFRNSTNLIHKSYLNSCSMHFMHFI